ncbi:hypothetical protein [Pseudomonas sp. BP8]|uniref:hypothetical protein n=1 Tax=Pseudomonas sp. BP8 TaxID=2817864 RepID=UPI001AEB4938|nr:hypothetical protein [Pseudomonas sp. BP8]MBP2262582.1 hypothetical protein [Pseudomonas sp. BP8]HDS1737728.1 hypothetical protein [Pseudomonas putida]
MFNLVKAPQLPPQLKWKYAGEPELLMWTIRARNYNTFVANCMFAFMQVLIAGGAYFVFSINASSDSLIDRVMSGLGVHVFTSLIILSMTHQRMNFAYRITQSGVEYCEWKDFPKWALKTIKWTAGITAVILIFMATIDPSFLLGALIGPGGMGLTYLAMANSKSYQAMHTEYHHHFLHWSELTKLTIAINRVMAEVRYSVPKVGSPYMTTGSLYVFFKRQEKDQVVTTLKKHLLPSTPSVTGKVDVLN